MRTVMTVKLGKSLDQAPGHVLNEQQRQRFNSTAQSLTLHSGTASINSHQQLQKCSLSILRSCTTITKILTVRKDPYQIQKVHVATPNVFPTAKEEAKTSAKPGKKKNATAKIRHAHKQTINISYLSVCRHTSQTAHESTDKHQQILTFESSIKHVQQNNVKPTSKMPSEISEAYSQYGLILFTAAWKLFHYLWFKEQCNKVTANKGSLYHNTWPAVFCPSFGGFFFFWFF